MKTIKLKQLALVLAFTISSNFVLFGQEIEEKINKTEFSLEIDPVTFGFRGYSLHLRVKPKNSDHLLIGVGAYAMDMPTALVDFNPNNIDKGWKLRLNQGYGAFGEYHFSEVNKKWFMGAQTSIQEYKIQNETIEGSEKFTNFLLMAYGGYTFQPFKFNLYIKPWAGIGYTTKIAGNNSLGNLAYDISPIIPFATLHIGYTF